MRYEEVLEEITLSDLENTPNHEIEDTQFSINDEKNKKEYTFGFSILAVNELMDMQLYIIGDLDFPIGETYNYNSYDDTQGAPLPKLGDIITNEQIAEEISSRLM